MNLSFFKSEPKPAFPRCEHRSPTGRQCSQPVCTTDPRFCGTHKPTPQEIAAAELTEAAGTLSSPEEVHSLLKAVTLLRIRGLITPKEANTYSHLCQNLFRAQREIAFHQQLREERQERDRPPREFTWNLPRPDRDDPPTPTAAEPAAAQSPTEPVGSGLPRSPLPAEPTAPTVASSSSKSSPSSTNGNSSQPAAKPSTPLNCQTSPIPTPPFDPNHFFPIDPTIPATIQDKNKNIPPPDEAECRRLAARRGLLFNRRRPVYPGVRQ
ncbi:MAG TPA: hypothetical protein VJX70_14085 [Candidatus Acidoferrum sp.]|nr:hypothetical protein [Candidatus Acidoferrum sp.]